MSGPLSYRAALQGTFGKREQYSLSSITDALFVYLDGKPEPESIVRVDSHFRGRPLVCLTNAWEEQIKVQYPNVAIYRRGMMRPACRFTFPEKVMIPEGYRLTGMDEAAFKQHPFSHGENYSCFAAFRDEGSGAVIYYNEEIVAAASSFLSLDGEVEMDISTKEAYQRKNLATACAAWMLLDCMKRGFRVHWDAQNDISRHLAAKSAFLSEKASDAEEKKMDRTILDWLLEEQNPEVRLRTLKEYMKLPDDDEKVVECKRLLIQSKVYERALKKLRKEKPWDKFDAIMAFAEWGLTRADIGKDIDSEVFALIESTGFKMLCGEPYLLRNLVKLGYDQEDIVKNEIACALSGIKEDGGFGCISTNKKINDPRKPHKSCARLTVEYLLLVAELHLLGYRMDCESKLVQYFTKRNIFYRTDDMKTPMVDVMLGTFYPSDPIKVGAQNILYALIVLGCQPDSEAMLAGYKVLDQQRLANGRYILTGSKSVPAFKVGNVGEENKWVTLYAYMARE